jgi:hypothetical protein
MLVYNLNDFTRGWFIGNFEPSLYNQVNFEAGVKRFKSGEFHEPHMHLVSKEYNVIVEGTCIVNGKTLSKDDIFVLVPYDPIHITFVTDTTICVIKTPSRDDKVVVPHKKNNTLIKDDMDGQVS